MKEKKSKTRKQEKTPRRRAHDVVMWQEDRFEGGVKVPEWVVYDSVSDTCYRFGEGSEIENHTAALKKFQSIKSTNGEKVNRF
jgi:hypothetical protein